MTCEIPVDRQGIQSDEEIGGYRHVLEQANREFRILPVSVFLLGALYMDWWSFRLIEWLPSS